MRVVVVQSKVSSAQLVPLLNRLLQLHSRSLPAYLASAKPWTPPGREETTELLAVIAEDHERRTNEIAEYILELGGVVRLGEYPMDFTDLHDLSYDYVLRVVVVRMRDDIKLLEELVSKLSHDPRGHALAAEALGAAQGHLQSIEELLSRLN